MTLLTHLISRRAVRPALAPVTVGLAALGLLALAPAASAQYYTAVNLTSLGYNPPLNINDAGQFSYSNAPQSPTGEIFLSGPEGKGPAQAIGTLNGLALNPGFVNDAGQVAGTTDGNEHAYLTGPNGSGPIKDLGSLGAGGVAVEGINALGQITGAATTKNDHSYHAFLSSLNGGPLKDLGTLPGTPGRVSSQGDAVNASGQVTGDSNDYAFISGVNGEGPLRSLGALGGSATYAQSTSFAINASGQVAGYAVTSDETYHAFRSGPNGGPLTDLGSLAGPDGSSLGVGINDAGTVVGGSSTFTPTGDTGGDSHAFIYSNGKMTDLNSLTTLPEYITLSTALEITNSGLIFAKGYNYQYAQDNWFILMPSSVNPVPEASTLVSFGLLALGGLVMVARRKKAGMASS